MIGAIGVEKGAEVLRDCLRDADARKLPIHFYLVGFSDRDNELLRSRRITITGRYAEDEVFERLEKSNCHFAFLPSVWPETFSYTLSIALAAGLYPVCFDLGAQRERVSKEGLGHLMPLQFTPSEINDALLALDPPLRPKSLPDQAAQYADIWKDYYDSPYASDDVEMDRPLRRPQYPNSSKTSPG